MPKYVRGTSSLMTQYNPVPYNFDFELYILVNNGEDGTQILEQILPYFTPEFTVTINTVPDMGIKADVPIVLNSASQTDEYEGDQATRRTIIWTLSFLMKGYVYPDIKTSAVIKTIEVNFRIQQTLRMVILYKILSYLNLQLKVQEPLTIYFLKQVITKEYLMNLQVRMSVMQQLRHDTQLHLLQQRHCRY